MIICCAVSNSDGFDDWLTSPVCNSSSGVTGSRLILSIASFKLREGMTVGAKVTLRKDRMYEFLAG